MDGGISTLGNDVAGFTPVRRKLSTINTRRPHNESEKEWTAARCNRLLRALKSRVAILNKDLSRVQGRENTAESKTGTTRRANQDTDWTQARKRVRRTYSTRGGRGSNDCRSVSHRIRTIPISKGVRPLIPGEISVPTPILNRVRGENVSAITPTVFHIEVNDPAVNWNKRKRTKDDHLHPRFSETLRDIRKQIPPNRYTIYEGIYNGLEALLKATIPDEPQGKRGGPKSLLSLCLSTIPHYISQEEEWFAAHMEETGSKSAINSRDISTEIYDDLEAFGSNGRGWKHLRSIVRSHGIQMISGAIRRRSLDAQFVGILTTLCIRTNAIKEAEILLSSLLSIGSFPRPKSVFTRFGDDPATQSLSMLSKFVEITGSVSFQYRQLSTLVSDGLLPLGWLASKELGPIWTKTIQVLAHGATDTDALLFVDSTLPLLAQSGGLGGEEDGIVSGGGVMIEATKQTFSSLLTTLLSIVILSGDPTSQIPVKSSELCVRRYENFTALIRSCLMQWELSHSFDIRGTLLVMANTLLPVIGRYGPDTEIDLVDILLNHLRQLSKSVDVLSPYNEIVTFICSVARCCGRGASNSGFEHLEKLHQKLESFASDRESDGGTILREIIADSALAFSQEVPHQKHLDYAARMEGRVHRVGMKPKVSLTPGHGLDSSRIGFRWEEGISEWVTATPSIGTNKWKDPTECLEMEGLVCETPFRPHIRRRTKERASVHMTARAPESTESICTSSVNTEALVSLPFAELAALEPGQDSEDEALDFTSSENDPIDAEDFRDELSGNSVQISKGLVENGSAPGVDDSEDDLATESLEEGQSNRSCDSEDELQPSSPQSYFSNASGHSPSSSPRSDDSEESLIDEPLTSVTSSADSHESSELGSGRRYIDRVPRLSRSVLQQGLQWQLFDGSDDELSFVSVSSEGLPILQDITNNVGPGTRRQGQKSMAARRQKPSRAFDDSLLGDSEDELGF